MWPAQLIFLSSPLQREIRYTKTNTPSNCMSTTTKRKLNVNKRTTPSFVEPEMVLKSRLNGSANGKHSKAADYQGSRVQAMLDNAPVNILYADVNLKIKYSNLASTLALEQISKYLPAMESIIGQSLGIFFQEPGASMPALVGSQESSPAHPDQPRARNHRSLRHGNL